jgi:quinol monooxygenase YgiN
MPTPATLFTVHLTAHDEDLRREIVALLGPVGTQPGCRRCVVARDAVEAARLVVMQEWETREALERYFRSEECRRLLALIELAEAPPELHVDSVAVREGMEAIAAARQSNVTKDSFRTNHHT